MLPSSSRPLTSSRRRGRAAWSILAASAVAVAMSLAVPVPARAAGPGDAVHGLEGAYYLVDPGTFAFASTPTSTVVDWDLDYDNMLPLYQQRTGRSENVGVRWTGYLTVPASGSYTFDIVGDNGFRLWVGDVGDADTPLIDFWVNQWDVPQTSGPVALTAGERVPFRLDLFQATGGANVHVTWVTPDGTEEQIPVSALTVPDDLDLPAVTGAVSTDGTGVTLDLDGAVDGVSADLATHLSASVDGAPLPVSAVRAGDDGSSLELTPSAPVLAGAKVRVAYDGDGGVSVGGAPLPAFDTPVTNGSTYTMQTRWADDVDPQNPLPDYPRPQMTRDDWQNLNGPWQLQPTDASFDVPFGQDLDDQVVVPYPVESTLSGIGKHLNYMVYRRTFTVPADWGIGTGQRLLLNFGAVDYHAVVYVNGQEVAEHTGGYEAFSVDVTDAVYGSGQANELVLHVTDTTAPDQIHGKQSNTPSGIFYTPTSGIWQTVWMEPVAAAHITRLDMTSDIDDDTLAVDVQTAGASASAQATVVAYDEGGHEVGRASGPADATVTVPVPDAHLWSPDDPYLYDLSVTLKDGSSTDRVGSYQGMRKIEVKADADGTQRIFLNGVRTFLLSTLDQGFWPDGVYTAPTDEALAWDIEQTKALGFNTIRKHIKVEPARWYYYADKIGMMVWQDMPAGSDRLAAGIPQQQYRAQLEGMVEQLKSTTSIIGWIPFNEGWGEWNLQDTGQIADWVKQLDPSRLVDAHSGENCCNSLGDSGEGDIIDWHQYTGPAAPTPDATRAAVDGEHGGFSLAIPGRTWPGGSVNPYGELDSKEALTEAYVQNTAQLIGPAQTYLSGSVYTQLTDVEGEVNGFWTYDRQVLKMDADAVRRINQKVIEVGSGDRDLDTSTTGLSGLAAWTFDEGSGTTSVDRTGNGHTLTLEDGASWDSSTPDGGYALHLDGVDDFASASVPELDTTGSYTVQARVRMDAPPASDWGTVVSAQGVTGRSPFFLQYGTALGGYAFSFADERAIASQAPTLGTWHTLVGVRDAAAGTIQLYVDGTLAASYATHAGILSDGTVDLGRAQWDFGDVDFFDGAVDEVKLYDVALDPGQVEEVSGTLVTPQASSMTPQGLVTIPQVPGVTYTVTVDGTQRTVSGRTLQLEPGQTAVVTAAPASGYSFGVATTTTSWTHTYRPPLAAVTPTVTGAARVGETLTAHPGAWAPGTRLSYQWSADGSAIAGATGSTLTLRASQRGSHITVTVTGAKTGYSPASATSRPTGAVAAGVLKVARPKIAGKARVGKKLTAKPHAKKWTTGTHLTYRWYQDGKKITGKKGARKKLRLTAKQRGTKITVKVTGTEPGYATVTVRSKKSSKVRKGHLRASKPKIKGKARVGKKLTAKPHAKKWTTGTHLTYRWYQDGKKITGKKGARKKLRLTAKQRGTKITVRVTGKKKAYKKHRVRSRPTAKVRG